MHRRNGRSDDAEFRAIVSKMRATREELPLDVDATTQAIKKTLDWRTYVRKYPWVCVGVAAGIGYLIVPKGLKLGSRNGAKAVQLPQRDPVPPPASKSFLAMAAPVVINAVVRTVVPRIVESLRPHAEPADENYEPFSSHRPR